MQDHKRALDGDKGLNTGGMGAYARCPCLTPELEAKTTDIVQRTVAALASEGTPCAQPPRVARPRLWIQDQEITASKQKTHL